MWVNRHFFRVMAIAMFAYPEPMITTVLGLTLLSVSFFLPEDGRLGNACTCGCDFHRCRVHREEPVMGAGALLNTPRGLRLDPHEVYSRTRYGFVPVPVLHREILGSTESDSVYSCNSWGYGWHIWPKLEGALFRRLSGFGSSAVVKCEYKALAGSRA